MSDDPVAAERFYKAKFIKENLERESSVSAFMAYKFDVDNGYEQADDIVGSKEVIYNSNPNDAVERSVNDVIQVGEIPSLSDDVKDNIARMIKQKHLAQRIEDRRDRYAAEDVNSHDYENQNIRQDYSDDIISEFERYGFGQDHLTKQFERRVAFQNVQAVLANEYTCQHHSDNMRNTQFTHDDRGKQDDEQHHAENNRGTRDRQIYVKVHNNLLSHAKVVQTEQNAK